MKRNFLILETYTGAKTLKDALADKNSANLLWLEILFNDSIPWESNLKIPQVRFSYRKAAIWYHHFKTMVDQVKPRKSLKEYRGKWDTREYRRFTEVLNYVADQTQ